MDISDKQISVKDTQGISQTLTISEQEETLQREQQSSFVPTVGRVYAILESVLSQMLSSCILHIMVLNVRGPCIFLHVAFHPCATVCSSFGAWHPSGSRRHSRIVNVAFTAALCHHSVRRVGL